MSTTGGRSTRGGRDSQTLQEELEAAVNSIGDLQRRTEAAETTLNSVGEDLAVAKIGKYAGTKD